MSSDQSISLKEERQEKGQEKRQGVGVETTSLSSFSMKQQHHSSFKQNHQQRPQTIISNRMNNNNINNKHNKDLSTEEKKEKREMKKLLKQEKKRIKLETRLRHAVARKDNDVEEKTRQQIKALQQKKNEGCDSNSTQILSVASLTLISSSKQQSSSVSLLDPKASYDNMNIFGNNNIANSNKEALLIMKKCEERAKSMVSAIYKELKRCQQEPPKKRMQNENGDGSDSGSWIISNGSNDKVDKEKQLQDTIKLLKHMTKGTQTKEMFASTCTSYSNGDNYLKTSEKSKNNAHVLWGYTKQKFYQRSMLVYKSLNKLNPLLLEDSSTVRKDSNSDEEDKLYREKVWNILTSCSFRNVCSIGCGPGCDVVGIIALLYSVIIPEDEHQQKEHDQKYLFKESSKSAGVQSSSLSNLTNIVLMDWVINDWDKIILQPLFQKVIIPKYFSSTCCKDGYDHNCRHNNNANSNASTHCSNTLLNVQTSFVDVTKPLLSSSRRNIFRNIEEFEGGKETEVTERRTKSSDDNNSTALETLLTTDTNRGNMSVDNTKTRAGIDNSNIDLYLFSYILTEQREKWIDFIIDLALISKKDALFYFAEPTPWQLHKLVHLFSSANTSEKICYYGDKSDIDDGFSETKPKANMQQQEVEMPKMKFIWIDSSFNCCKSIQNLMTRSSGPGVLLGIKI